MATLTPEEIALEDTKDALYEQGLAFYEELNPQNTPEHGEKHWLSHIYHRALEWVENVVATIEGEHPTVCGTEEHSRNQSPLLEMDDVANYLQMMHEHDLAEYESTICSDTWHHLLDAVNETLRLLHEPDPPSKLDA